MEPKSPYIVNSGRLGEVVAAIQAMAVYSYHMRSFEHWAVSISGDESRAAHWRKVFEEHPEFFRLDTTRQLASLVWRRQQPKRFHAELGRRLSSEELAELRPSERQKLTREPLGPAEVRALIETAISMHAREVELQRERRWWVPLVASALGALVGGIVGGLLHR